MSESKSSFSSAASQGYNSENRIEFSPLIHRKEMCKMEAPMTAIEMTGTVDENHKLQVDGLLPFAGPKRVRVIVLSPLTEIADDWTEAEWLTVSLNNPAFEYLRDPEEDIYSISDGKPFYEV